MTSNQNPTPNADDIVWGAPKIAPHLGRSVKGTYHVLESGKIPGAKKVGGRWGLNLPVFRGSFENAA